MKDIVDLYKLADITDVIQAYPNTLTKHTHTHTHTHTHNTHTKKNNFLQKFLKQKDPENSSTHQTQKYIFDAFAAKRIFKEI